MPPVGTDIIKPAAPSNRWNRVPVIPKNVNTHMNTQTRVLIQYFHELGGNTHLVNVSAAAAWTCSYKPQCSHTDRITQGRAIILPHWALDLDELAGEVMRKTKKLHIISFFFFYDVLAANPCGSFSAQRMKNRIVAVWISANFLCWQHCISSCRLPDDNRNKEFCNKLTHQDVDTNIWVQGLLISFHLSGCKLLITVWIKIW